MWVDRFESVSQQLIGLLDRAGVAETQLAAERIFGAHVECSIEPDDRVTYRVSVGQVTVFVTMPAGWVVPYLLEWSSRNAEALRLLRGGR